jgi:hypothetical protein
MKEKSMVTNFVIKHQQTQALCFVNLMFLTLESPWAHHQ